VTTRTSCSLACDHTDVVGQGGTKTYRCCPEVVTDGLDGGPRTAALPESTYLFTKTDARREARKLGWATAVHTDGSRGRGALFDYCPAHKDPDVRAQACALTRARMQGAAAAGGGS